MSKYKSLQNQYQLFNWSQPVGYDFAEVEHAITDYKTTISDIGELLEKKDSIIESLKQENSRLNNELINARIQMESVIAPSYSEEQSLEILEDFKEPIAPELTQETVSLKEHKPIIE